MADRPPPRPHPRPLIVRLCNWIGDVVLGLPALQRLQAAGYDLHLYGKGWAPTLLSGYSWPVTVRATTLRKRVQQLTAMRQQYVALDAGMAGRINALAMPNSFSSALELRLAGLRVAGVPRDGRSLLLAQRIAPGAGPHALQSFWALAGDVLGSGAGLLGSGGAPPADIGLQIAAPALQRAHAQVAQRGWAGGYICIAPFAAGTVHKMDKRWPGFPALAQQLIKMGLTVVVCPGPGEVDEAYRAYPGAQVVADLPLDVYAALLQGSRLVIANDTGPGHIAAAVGAPLISVLGPTKVAQWRPWGTSITVLSARPDWPTLGQVMAAVQDRLACTQRPP